MGSEEAIMRKLATLFSSLVIMALILTVTACSSGGGTQLPTSTSTPTQMPVITSTPTTTPQNSGSESSKDVAARMMKIAPEYVNRFAFYDWKAYREDNILRGYYEWIKEENYGDFLDSIDYMGGFDEGNLYLYEGNFTSLDYIVQQIKKGKEWSFYEYKGVKVATILYFYDVALLGDTCIEGHPDDVKQCIDIFLNGKPSFYDHSGIKDVLNRLPSGISMEISYTDPSAYEFIAEYGYIVAGTSTTFVDGNFHSQHVEIPTSE
jgi:predicted small lipoprotein YifL